jgi:hypothetical protein
MMREAGAGKSMVFATASTEDTAVTNAPDGFTYRLRKSGDVELLHHGRPAGVLRGATAVRFLADVESEDPQELMARLTGNYKHGNERTSRNHPRNRPR